ncbi:hypothetical protein WK59_13475 [Burkholderia ubonensis]|uniref:O-linked N-acetylglucosamine transferase, SPINDLY family protein n=1 Tax=Burkholderia ubonensis TaxID=101571 RepID=UPI00075CAE18|nr:hypothetical protein [Burkholderia ubonensis]KVT84458.1 hypothetical protein WK59_13475 [Burkholderia ubonensis]KVU20825.1 hypothetical protein WK62_03040 [Burkholderia ubonensis]
MENQQDRQALFEIARGHHSRGELEEARRAYQTIGEQFAIDFDAAAQELLCSIHICHWQRYDYLQRVLRDTVRHSGGNVLGEPILASPYFNAQDLRTIAERHANEVCRKALNDGKASGPAQPDAPVDQLLALSAGGNRLRVGFLGCDFHDQATTYLMVGLIEQHDREHFEYIAYDYGSERDDAARRRILAAFDTCRCVPHLTSAEIAELIRRDQIDILVFLRNPADPRCEVLARRPAPVQLAYLYNPSGFGSSLVDFLVADSSVIPYELEHHYAEKIARLGRCYQPNDVLRPIPQSVRREEFNLPSDRFVLANMGSPFKITPTMFDVWCTILRQHHECVLWLLEPRDHVAANLRREATIRGVDPSRLIFGSIESTDRHISRLACADLMLDTYPYGGHTGSSDALWAGVPVLTLVGETFASRVAASLLAAVGLYDLAARTEQEYIEIAGRLIKDRSRHAAYRTYLSSRRWDLPLFDIQTYARDFEHMLKSVANRNTSSSGA